MFVGVKLQRIRIFKLYFGLNIVKGSENLSNSMYAKHKAVNQHWVAVVIRRLHGTAVKKIDNMLEITCFG